MGFINQRQNAKQAKIYKLRLSEKSEQNFVNMTKEFCNACMKGCSLSWGQMRLFNTRDKMNTSICTSPHFLSMCYTTNVGGGNSYEERGAQFLAFKLKGRGGEGADYLKIDSE